MENKIILKNALRIVRLPQAEVIDYWFNEIFPEQQDTAKQQQLLEIQRCSRKPLR